MTGFLNFKCEKCGKHSNKPVKDYYDALGQDSICIECHKKEGEKVQFT